MKKVFKVIDILEISQKLRLFWVVFFGFLAAILEFLSVASIYPLVLKFTSEKHIQNNSFVNEIIRFTNENLPFFSILIFFFSIIIFKNIYLLFYQYFTFQVMDKIFQDISKKLLFFYLKENYVNFIKINSGNFIRDFTTYCRSFREYILSLANIITELFAFILLIFLLISVSFKASIIALFFLLIFFILYYVFVKQIIERFSKQKFNYEAETNKSLINIYNSIVEIKIGNHENNFSKFFLNNIFKYIFANRIIIFIYNSPRFILEFSIALILLLIFVFIGFTKTELIGLMPIIALYLFAAYRLLPGLNKLNYLQLSLKSNQPSVNHIFKIFNKFKFKKINAINKKPLEKINNIKLKNLNFKYYKNSKVFKSNINLSLKEGEILGVFGGSGSGKSTLGKIISGLLVDYTGEIQINEKKIKNNFFENNYIKMSYISQKFFFLNSSLENNISLNFNEKEKNLSRLNYALKFSEASDFLKKKKIFWNTQLNEDAIEFSGGQRQRLAISRAIYNESSLLIFDEATNALDKKTENKIINKIFKLKKGRMIILISHNKKIINKCDKIINLN